MKIQTSLFLPSAIAIAAFLFFVLTAEAFVPLSSSNKPIMTQLRAEIGESGVAFEHVAREWRCKVSTLKKADAPLFAYLYVVSSCSSLGIGLVSLSLLVMWW
jgi:hypothetical protein